MTDPTPIQPIQPIQPTQPPPPPTNPPAAPTSPAAMPDPQASRQDHRPVGEAVSQVVPSEAMDDERLPDAAQMSLAARLRQPRTIISIAVPLFIIGLFVVLNGAQLSKVPGLILNANPALILAAFAVFYLGFPLRGLRWAILLRGTGLRIGVKDSTEIILLSWLVNCVVPAKLGDVYRAYLLKINSTASLSRTFGTVFIERVLDLFAIAILGIAAGYWSFRSGLPPAIQIVFGIGIVVVIVLAIGLFTMRNFGRRIIVALRFLPHMVLELYDRFEQGVFGALKAHQLPVLGAITAGVWMTESLRLYLVIQALGFDDVTIGLSGAVFVALIGSLLTAVPLSPAGLGIVEAGVVGVLTVAYGVPLPEATAIALLDRVISVFSVIVVGSVTYFVSAKPRGMGRIANGPDASVGAATAA